MRSKRGMVIDGRGVPRKVDTIYRVKKESGVERSVLIKKGDTKSFVVSFLICWVVFYVVGHLISVTLQLLLPLAFRQTSGTQSLHFIPIFPSLGDFVGFSIWMVILALIYSRVHWRSTTRGMRAILRIGRCPSCLYELDGVPTEADGCIVCPECGGAWKIGCS